MTAPDDGASRAGTAPMPPSPSTVGSSDDQTRTSNSVVCEFPRPASDSARSVLNLTELGNAKRLVARFGTSIRYVPPWKKWLVWDSRRWGFDQTGEVHRYAKKTIRLIYTEAHAGRSGRCPTPEGCSAWRAASRRDPARHTPRMDSALTRLRPVAIP